jgi:hypothetical protein
MKVIGNFQYGEAAFASLAVEAVMQPVVVVTAFPQLNTNSAQAYFEFKVQSTTGELLPAALAYYRLSPTDAYTLIGVNRFIGPFAAQVGMNYIDIKASINTLWTPILAYQWNVDLTPPAIQSVVPATGSVDISTQAPIVVTFNEPVQSLPILQNNAILIQPPLAGVWTSSTSGAVYTFTPTGRLEYDTDYSILVTNAVKDLAGNQFSPGVISSFRTAPRTNVIPESPNFDGLVNITQTSDNKPQLVFNVPADFDDDMLHFTVEITSVVSGQVQLFSSLLHPDNFIFYPTSGSRTVPFPTAGVYPVSGRVVFKTPVALQSGEHNFRVYADDRR